MEAQELVQVPDDLVVSKIFMIRDKKVMIDSDLARLYDVETRYLNKAVGRNIKRFPADFMFQLTIQEHRNLMFQIGTSSSDGWGGNRKLPYAFTEQGVAMLSGILNSDRAISVNIQIMRIFTRIRSMRTDNTELRLIIEELRKKTENNAKNIEIVFRYLDEFVEKKEEAAERNLIGYKLPATLETKTGALFWRKGFYI